MNKDTCGTIDSLLVEYLDGDLGDSESQRVAGHIAQCRECRANADLLQRSLAIAKHQWEEAVSGSPTITARAAERRRRNRSSVAVGAACAAVVMLGVAIVALQQGRHLVDRSELHAEFREGEAPAEPSSATVSTRQKPRPPGSATVSDKGRQEPAIARNQSPRPADEAPGQADIDAMILRDVQSARLAASARLLASQAGLEEFSDRAASYLSRTYGDHQSSARLKPAASENGS